MHTKFCPTFIEKLLLSCSDRSIIRGWNAVPKSTSRTDLFGKCKYQHTRSHEVACSHCLSLNAARWTAEPASAPDHRRLQNHGNRERQNPGCPQRPFDSQCRALHAAAWGYYNQYQYTNVATAYFPGWIECGRVDLRLQARISVSDMNIWTFII